MSMKHKSTTSALLIISMAMVTVFTAARTGPERTIMIKKSTPVLHVKNVEPSLKFWTERFGFKKTIEVPEGDHIGFAALENDKVEVMYQTYSGMKAGPANPLAKVADQGPSFLFMEVPDINAVSAVLNGADIVQPLHDSS